MNSVVALNRPEKAATIRLAQPEDVERMVAYGQQFWEQTRYFAAGVEYDIDTVTYTTHQLIDEGIAMYAEDDDGKIVALMLVVISPLPMNWHHLTACEWVFYVEPDYRRSGLGVKLIQHAEELLKMQKVTFFTLVSLSNVTPEAAHKLYESLGFECSETNFTKELTWQS